MDPPIDNVDPKTEADECLRISLGQLVRCSHVANRDHIRRVCEAALERIEELEAHEYTARPLMKIRNWVATDTRFPYIRLPVEIIKALDATRTVLGAEPLPTGLDRFGNNPIAWKE